MCFLNNVHSIILLIASFFFQMRGQGKPMEIKTTCSGSIQVSRMACVFLWKKKINLIMKNCSMIITV